jgi:hypothetical protein
MTLAARLAPSSLAIPFTAKVVVGLVAQFTDSLALDGAGRRSERDHGLAGCHGTPRPAPWHLRWLYNHGPMNGARPGR